jgi:phenylpropionate dioxygenase-like ring-hydroxylating dioxygenase large terminal subunit
MKMIPNVNYFEEEIFHKEEKSVFQNTWLYACLKSEVPHKSDYITLEVGNRSLIIYNNGEEIKAFQNLCPHRFYRIFTKKNGNATLTCGFHNWCFNGKGQNLSSIFKGKDDLKHKFSLKSYPIEFIGEFIFFNFNESPSVSFFDQLGGSVDYLEKISNLIGNRIYTEDLKHNCNWKFICENVIDNIHCFSLHENTLMKLGYCNLRELKMDKFNNNSVVTTPNKFKTDYRKRELFLNKYIPRIEKTDIYQHAFIYPNLTVAIFEGLNITIGNILPQSATSTNYNLSFYQGKLEESSISSSTNTILAEMAKDTIEFGTLVFEEDRVVLEVLQNSIKEASHSGMIFETEDRIKWFFEAYFNTFCNG